MTHIILVPHQVQIIRHARNSGIPQIRAVEEAHDIQRREQGDETEVDLAQDALRLLVAVVREVVVVDARVAVMVALIDGPFFNVLDEVLDLLVLEHDAALAGHGGWYAAADSCSEV